MNRASVTRGTISKGLMYVYLESQKEGREKMGQEKCLIK